MFIQKIHSKEAFCTSVLWSKPAIRALKSMFSLGHRRTVTLNQWHHFTKIVSLISKCDWKVNQNNIFCLMFPQMLWQNSVVFTTLKPWQKAVAHAAKVISLLFSSHLLSFIWEACPRKSEVGVKVKKKKKKLYSPSVERNLCVCYRCGWEDSGKWFFTFFIYIN